MSTGITSSTKVQGGIIVSDIFPSFPYKDSEPFDSFKERVIQYLTTLHQEYLIKYPSGYHFTECTAESILKFINSDVLTKELDDYAKFMDKNYLRGPGFTMWDVVFHYVTECIDRQKDAFPQ